LLVWLLWFNWTGLFDDLWWLLWEWLNGLGLLIASILSLAFWAISFRGGGQESGGLEFWEGGGGQRFGLTTFAGFEWLFENWGCFEGLLGGFERWLSGGGDRLTFLTAFKRLFENWGGFGGFLSGFERWLSGGGGRLTLLTAFNWFFSWGQGGSGSSGKSGGQFSLTFSTFLGHFGGLICGSINWESGGGDGLTFSSFFGDIRSQWGGTGGWDGGGFEGLTFGTDFGGLGAVSWGKGGSSKWGLGRSLTFEETTETVNCLSDDVLWSGGPG
jgi:hypothetical protein